MLLSAGSLIPADGDPAGSQGFLRQPGGAHRRDLPGGEEPRCCPGHGEPLPSAPTVCSWAPTCAAGAPGCWWSRPGPHTSFGQIAERLSSAPAGERVRTRHPAPGLPADRGDARAGGWSSSPSMSSSTSRSSIRCSFPLPWRWVSPRSCCPPSSISTFPKGRRPWPHSGVIVRRLESIENFGSMDILCTDKTGTLTLGVVKLDGALDAGGKASTWRPARCLSECPFSNRHCQPARRSHPAGGQFQGRRRRPRWTRSPTILCASA